MTRDRQGQTEEGVRYLVLPLMPKEERLAVAIRPDLYRQTLAEETDGRTYLRPLEGEEAFVVPWAALGEKERHALQRGEVVGLSQRPGAEVAAEVYLLQDAVPAIWVRLDRGGLGVLLEALLDPEAA
ncbi:MAG: hypothetical protein ABWJ90_06320 [Thermus sp.]|uniref:hypothetical protein n=1 Tax=Thermus sp. TaxID=275 RepID=UPI00351B2010